MCKGFYLKMMPSLNTEESASLYNHILIGSMSLHGDWIQEAK